MNTSSYIESLSSTNSIVDLQNLLNAVQNRVHEIKLEKAAEARQTVKELLELFGHEALGLPKPKTKKTSSALTRIHKYLNSETGESWPGSGGLPSWILNRDNLELYLNPAWVEHQATKKADKKAKQGAIAVVVGSELAADPMITISANQSALNINSDDGKLE